MKNKAKTEKQMRATVVPTPDTGDALVEYVNSLVDRKHDYGTCVYAMSMAAVAAFQFVARKLGVTGFQASCADLDVIRRTRSMECPFVILNANDTLYPQYDLRAKLEECLSTWKDWQRVEAKKLIAKNRRNKHVAPEVREHWTALATGK